ncbi:MAG: FkbM family methyltransferase [Tabrizicola sp.]|nr:FkbM family methyltransferase [Tabrizicola sp.]HMS94941.1 FkbM family methyltransferase [Tabrizicola sp.]
MPHYLPETRWEKAVAIAAGVEGGTGKKARRWLRGRYVRRCMADFDRHLARLGPGSVCLDLGANVGRVTRQLAATGATVHAYEPDPLAFAALSANVGHLPNVVLHQAAVAATGGQGQLRRHAAFAADPLRHTQQSSLVRTWAHVYDGGESIPVETRAFRAVLDGIGGPVALVKMDIEGAEFDILRQVFADPAAHDIDAIFCETHEYDLQAEKPEVERMIRASEALARPHVNLYWP